MLPNDLHFFCKTGEGEGTTNNEESIDKLMENFETIPEGNRKNWEQRTNH